MQDLPRRRLPWVAALAATLSSALALYPALVRAEPSLHAGSTLPSRASSHERASSRPSEPASQHASRSTSAKHGKSRKRRHKGGSPPHHTPSLPLLTREIRCPEDMVAVAGQLCIDRYEATLVDSASGELLSAYYPPSQKLALDLFERWSEDREKSLEGSAAHDLPLPILPEVEHSTVIPKAMSWPGSVPNGYLSGRLAQVACESAGKRLCSEAEWVTACRGEHQTHFPYGDHYKQDACNVFRNEHPARVLHGNASTGLSDPRLNEIEVDGDPLLRPTGNTPACVSVWGDDAIYDMNGNLDEWIEDPNGTFVGGFFSRDTRNGCDARVQAHGFDYFDYSLGVRCCKDPELP